MLLTYQLRPEDNVATALQPLSAGTSVPVHAGSVRLVQDIPFGHKFAVHPIKSGALIYKYGEVIGAAAAEIAAGEHVHLHNVRSLRGGTLA